MSQCPTGESENRETGPSHTLSLDDLNLTGSWQE